MKIALERLGVGKCHHLLTPMFENVWTTRVRQSATALATKSTALRQFYLRKRFDGYDAVLDLPGSACVDDLIQMYPDAKVTTFQGILRQGFTDGNKVILTLRRNADVWLDSYLGMGIDPRSPIFRILGFWAPTVSDSSNMMFAWAAQCERRFPSIPPVPCLELYAEHANWVRSIVPKDRLLEFEPSMGWEPLCKFLGKDVPLEDYPRSNDRNVIKNFKIIAMGIGIVGWVWILLAFKYFFFSATRAVPVWVQHKICDAENCSYVS